VQSAELQWKVISDSDLKSLFGLSANSSADEKARLAIGIIINHFAALYDLYEMGHIPERFWEPFKNDMERTFSHASVQERWGGLQKGHRREFVAYVEKLLGQRTQA
jgi:hypothetical protein